MLILLVSFLKILQHQQQVKNKFKNKWRWRNVFMKYSVTSDDYFCTKFFCEATLNPHVYLSNIMEWRRNFMVMIIFVIIMKLMRFYLGMLTEDVLHMFVFLYFNFAFIIELNNLVSPWNFYCSAINQYFSILQKGVDSFFIKKFMMLKCVLYPEDYASQQFSNKRDITIGHNHKFLTLFAHSMSFCPKLRYTIPPKLSLNDTLFTKIIQCLNN